MCNCGKKRAEMYSRNAAAGSVQEQFVNFEYTGKSSLKIVGNATKKTYYFNRPGDIQPVSYHDAPYLLLCPLLKRTWH
jgi:hypothetical protein